MKQKTHLDINEKTVGKVIKITEGHSLVELKTTSEMVADDKGLIHGGFIFGLADYAAMIAVNHPYVVLGGANVRFLKPCKYGELLKAEAVIIEQDDRKSIVNVKVFNKKEIVFDGNFDCFVLKKHVLEGK